MAVPDRRFVALIIILLLFVGLSLHLANTLMPDATPSEEYCQKLVPFTNTSWCDCNKSLQCADEWDHNCGRMKEVIDCHLNGTLAAALNETVEL